MNKYDDEYWQWIANHFDQPLYTPYHRRRIWTKLGVWFEVFLDFLLLCGVVGAIASAMVILA